MELYRIYFRDGKSAAFKINKTDKYIRADSPAYESTRDLVTTLAKRGYSADVKNVYKPHGISRLNEIGESDTTRLIPLYNDLMAVYLTKPRRDLTFFKNNLY